MDPARTLDLLRTEYHNLARDVRVVYRTVVAPDDHRVGDLRTRILQYSNEAERVRFRLFFLS